jgi:hypothetical protein
MITEQSYEVLDNICHYDNNGVVLNALLRDEVCLRNWQRSAFGSKSIFEYLAESLYTEHFLHL